MNWIELKKTIIVLLTKANMASWHNYGSCRAFESVYKEPNTGLYKFVGFRFSLQFFTTFTEVFQVLFDQAYNQTGSEIKISRLLKLKVVVQKNGLPSINKVYWIELNWIELFQIASEGVQTLINTPHICCTSRMVPISVISARRCLEV